MGIKYFYCHEFVPKLEKASSNKSGATIFGYYVNDPKEFGVVEFADASEFVRTIQKRTGLYSL